MEFLLSFLMVIVIVALLAGALNEYYKSVKTEKAMLEKRQALEQGAFSEGIMDAGLSHYERTNGVKRTFGQENIYREDGVNKDGAYRNKIYNDGTENIYIDNFDAKILHTPN